MSNNQEKRFILKIADKKEVHCVRCGISKKEIRKEKFDCCVYGTQYKQHIYNKPNNNT